MSGKYALIIGNTEYTDPGLAQLTAPGKDAEDFARILKNPERCGFDDVNLILNQPEYIVRGAIDEFYDQKKSDDLLVLYFSGHGVRDELGSLYLAVKNTMRSRLRSTAIKSDYIREAMDQSRSRRQVLILDCCNSGAFAQGTKAALGVSIGTATAFEAGYGRIILTASDSTQFAWEGDKVIGETENSLFTHFLVQGLEGEADQDSDGRITVDELYDYAYEKVQFVNPKQTPSKFSSKQQGEIVLRQIMRMEDIKPVSLPEELVEAIDDSRVFVRDGAVQQLGNLLKSRNLGLARSARAALERMEREDDSRRVASAATQALKAVREAEQLALRNAEEESLAAEKAKPKIEAKEAERLSVEQKTDKEHLSIAKTEAEQLFTRQNLTLEAVPEEVSSNAEGNKINKQVTLIWIILGAAISGAVGGAIGWTISGAMLGLAIAIALYSRGILSTQQSLFWIVLTWSISGIIGWQIDFRMPIGGFLTGGLVSWGIGGLITAILLKMEQVLSHDQSPIWITLGWAIAGAVGWLLGGSIGDMGSRANGAVMIGWATGWGIGAAIGGAVMVWNIRRKHSLPSSSL